MPKIVLILGALVAVLVGGAGWGVFRLVRGTGPGTHVEQLLHQADLRPVQLELRTQFRDRPNDPEPNLHMALVKLRLNDPAAAEKELLQARDLGADPVKLSPELGQAFWLQGRFDDMLAQLPSSGPTAEITARLLLLRTAAQLARNDRSGAEASLAAAEAAAPGRAETAAIAARIAFARNDLPAAERFVDTILQRSSGDEDALMMKLRLLQSRSSPDVLAAADRAVAAAPWAATPRLARANLLMLAGQDTKAADDLRLVLQNEPRNAVAQYGRAVLTLRAGQFKDAQDALQQLAPLAQQLPRIQYFHAYVALRLGQAKTAEELAARYARRVTADADGALLLAQAELAVQRPDLALAALERIEGDPDAAAAAEDLRGAAFAALGRPAEAAASFGRAAALAPDNVSVLGHLALQQAELGSAETVRTLERLGTVAPERPDALAVVVRAALLSGDLDRAGPALDRLRATEGDSERVGILSGTLALARTEPDAAESVLSGTVQRFPAAATPRLALSRVLVMQGRGAEAAAVLQPGLAADPANMRALTAVAGLHLKLGTASKAFGALEAAQATRPSDPSIAALLAEAYTQNGEPERAVGMLRSSAATRGTPGLRVALAEAEAAAGDRRAAQATLDEVARSFPDDPGVVESKARILLRGNDLDGARAAWSEGLARFPGYYPFMSGLVAAEGRTRGTEAALRVADGLRRNPANLPEIAVLKGEALIAARRFPEAAEVLGAEYRAAPAPILLSRLVGALVLSGRAEDAAGILRDRLREQPRELAALRMLADIDARSGRTDAARKGLEAVLAVRPDDAPAANNLALLYLALGEGRALPMARRAFALAATADTADTLGWVMARSGQAAAALPFLRRAAAERPADTEPAYHLAVATSDSGDREEAIRILRRLVSRTADFSERPAAQTLLATLETAR